MEKTYIIDTNVLLDDPNCITTLMNGEENNIVIPYKVLLELDNLKRDPVKRYLVKNVITSINENYDKIQFIKLDNHELSPDLEIISEINHHQENFPDGFKFVSNDRIMRLLCKIDNIETEEYKSSVPFLNDYEKYNGFTDDKNLTYNNSFLINKNGELLFRNKESIYKKTYTEKLRIWNIEPKNIYQAMALHMMNNVDYLHVVSLQSQAGFGKSILALASAFDLLDTPSLGFKKIYISKPACEIGESLGFLPGEIDDKYAPYMAYLQPILKTLDERKNLKKYISKRADGKYSFRTDKIELLPIQYIRGMNIDNAIVILDEIQNLSRHELKSILTRMGENVKCFCLGDVKQIDNKYLNEYNNGMNWLIKYFIVLDYYAHLTLKGEHSRGPICDMVLQSGM